MLAGFQIQAKPTPVLYLGTGEILEFPLADEDGNIIGDEDGNMIAGEQHPYE